MNLKCLALSVLACMTIQVAAMESSNQEQSEGNIAEQIQKLTLQKARIDDVVAWYKSLDEKEIQDTRHQFSILAQVQVDSVMAEMAAKFYKSIMDGKGCIHSDYQITDHLPELKDLSSCLAQQFCNIMFLTTDALLVQSEEKAISTPAELVFITCREFNKQFYDAVDKDGLAAQIINALNDPCGDFQKFFKELKMSEKETEEHAHKSRLNLLLTTILNTINKVPLKEDDLANPESFSQKLANQIEMLKHVQN